MTKSGEINTVLGLMSGTSLDGLDIALCQFKENEGSYEYQIIEALTVEYSDHWKDELKNVFASSAVNYFKLNQLYGHYIGTEVVNFLTKFKLKAEAIASHGHTVFHQPESGFSTQIGSGATIAATTGITTVCDFRSLDVGLGGQGAPLVPVGDKLLFSNYEACLNLGGIANISYDNKNKHRIAFDICIANMAFNHLASKKGMHYDFDGELASAGKIIPELLMELNSLPYFTQSGSKSMGIEWFERNMLPKLEVNKQHSLEDLMATCSEHTALQICNVLNNNELKNVLVTGGGAYNNHLIARIKANSKTEIIIPDHKTINFKEALIFAFLGYLRLNHKTNTLCTVTGAKQDSIGGAVYVIN